MSHGLIVFDTAGIATLLIEKRLSRLVGTYTVTVGAYGNVFTTVSGVNTSTHVTINTERYAHYTSVVESEGFRTSNLSSAAANITTHLILL